MQKNGNIILVGPMGSGKTTIGRQLARVMSKTFYDSDHVIEAQSGASIALIFDHEGEQGFREREQKAIRELTHLRNIVLATGGGAVLNQDNRLCFKQSGLTVYLRTPVAQLYARTHRDRNRPLLQTADPFQRLKEIAEFREPLYLEVADVVIDTDHRSVWQVVREISRIGEQQA
jgi:shikimate kinase